MASISFVNDGTLVKTAWLADVNSLVWDVFSGATTVALARTALGIPFPIAASSGGTGVTNNAANTLTFSGNFGLILTLSAATSLTLPTTGTLAILGANTFTGVQTMTSPALTTPAITGLATGSGVATANTASTLVARDASGDFSAGKITATALNKWTVTAPTTAATLTAGADSLTYTMPIVTALIPSEQLQQVSKSVAYTTVLADANKHILHPTTDNVARTFTIDSNANVAYAVGTALTFVNTVNTVTIAITTDTMTLAGGTLTGSRTLAAYGIATALKLTSTTWIISGTNLT